jgi:hypothetical protein
MADTAVSIKDGAGANVPIDAFSMGNGDVRQAVVIGDSAVAAQVAGVTSDNRLQVKTDFTATAVITSTAVSTTSVTLLAADATNGRVQVILYNDTNQIVYINLNATAATTSAFSFEMPPGAYWESPRNFVGAITAITAVAATGAVKVTVL